MILGLRCRHDELEGEIRESGVGKHVRSTGIMIPDDKVYVNTQKNRLAFGLHLPINWVK